MCSGNEWRRAAGSSESSTRAEEGLAERWSCSAVVRTNGSVEVVPDFGYRTGEMGKVEVLCCGEDCEWRDEHWFHDILSFNNTNKCA